MGVPDVVWVPSHPVPPDADLTEGRVRFELRELDGRPVAVAFSTMERLVEQLGHWQPWLAIETSKLTELMGAVGVTQILVDPDMGASPGRWEREDVEAFTVAGTAGQEGRA